MNEYDKLISELKKRSDDLCDNLQKDIKRNDHYINVIHETPNILADLDNQFKQKTRLDDLDISILFVATALQVIRQFYFTSPMKRMPDSEAADSIKGHHNGHSDRHHALYNPTLEQIKNNPVPFDLNYKADGKLKGGGKLGHRAKTLGHDPLLGLIIGTANIATSTVTLNDMSSYHVKTGITKSDVEIDSFYRKASTARVLSETANKMKDVRGDGIKKVCWSMYYEIKHLQSDLQTKNSLPIPIISAFNPQLASSLAQNGLDMFNVVKYGRYVASAETAMLINQFVAIFHGLFFNGSSDMEYQLYATKTKRIINYSNIIASMTNLVKVFITRDISQLDIGGIAVCVFEVMKNKEYIRKVKNEFVFGQYKDIFLDENREYIIEK